MIYTCHISDRSFWTPNGDKMASLSVKTNKVPISKISINTHRYHDILLLKQKQCFEANGSILKDSLEILLLLHPVVLTNKFELIAGINSYYEWRKFCLENPLEQESKFTVLVLNNDLTDYQLQLFQQSQSYTENLLLSKYLPSSKGLLNLASHNIEEIRNYKPALLKSDGSINRSNFSKELGQKFIRSVSKKTEDMENDW